MMQSQYIVMQTADENIENVNERIFDMVCQQFYKQIFTK